MFSNEQVHKWTKYILNAIKHPFSHATLKDGAHLIPRLEYEEFSWIPYRARISLDAARTIFKTETEASKLW